ncbi:MAG: hypothetical protein LUH15_15880 [Tannerellaceae bacterium]|nr:hypothetical protein [Tannerellaceae bacterium]
MIEKRGDTPLGRVPFFRMTALLSLFFLLRYIFFYNFFKCFCAVFDVFEFLEFTSGEVGVCPILGILGVDSCICFVKEFMGKCCREVVELHFVYDGFKIGIISVYDKAKVCGNAVDGLPVTLFGEYGFFRVVS